MFQIFPSPFRRLSDQTREEHEHSFGRMASIDYAPVPGGHTSFMLLFCDCGAAALFPKSNFLLCTPEYQQQLRAKLTSDGYRLVA